MFKKRGLAVYILLGVVLFLSGCVGSGGPQGLRVHFDTDGGTAVSDLYVGEAVSIEVPQAPEKPGFIFAGWYLDEAKTILYNFEYEAISQDTTLYAKWKAETDFMTSFKILSIGNSFSEDAHKYLYSIAESYGIPSDKIIIANMYIGGAELVQHVTNLNQNNNAYTYQVYTSATKTDTPSKTLLEAIAAEDWDVVTFQQASHHSGLPSTYADYVSRLVKFVETNATNPNVQIAWHMTWAYQQTSNHSGFLNYDREQMTMYNAILDALDQKIDTLSQIQYVIPSGTAIQNARTSYIGDAFTRDGYHLSDPLGRYIAGLSFFSAITGYLISEDTITFRPNGVSETQQLLALEAVNQALIKPREVTPSTYTVEPEPEVIPVNGVAYTFDYVQGFWGSGATAVSPETDALHKSFAAVMPIPKYLMPVGSEITIAEGYQYRIIFFSKTGENYTVVNRSDLYQVSYLVLDEALWSNYDYIGFNIATNPYTDISARLDDVASKLKLYHPEGTGLGHVDTELTWSLGTYSELGNAIETSNLHFASNPLTPAYYNFDTVLEVSTGYQIAYVVLSYALGTYTVNSISSYQTEVYVDSVFAENKELIAFIVTSISGTEDLTNIDPNTIISAHPKEVIHFDTEMTFISGYWESGKTSITTTNANMDFLNSYAASQPQSKHYYQDVTSITLADGYQVRVIALSYDGFGTFTVLSRSNWTVGTITLDDTFWGATEYIAFNISTVPTTNISTLLDTLPHAFTYNHAPLSFSLGYWNTNGSTLTASTTFAGSNIFGRQFLPSGSVITVEAGYQLRVNFLSYHPVDGYKVIYRTENFLGTFTVNDGFYQDYQYISFNISSVPSTNLTDTLNTLASKITITPFSGLLIPHNNLPLTFSSGYWNNYAISITTGDTAFIKGFAASNVLSKSSLESYSQVEIASGYQVRVIYMDYSYNQYSVMLRTNNLTGTIVLDDTFWGDYQYVAFNISTVVSSDLSGSLDTLPEKLTFS